MRARRGRLAALVLAGGLAGAGGQADEPDVAPAAVKGLDTGSTGIRK